MMSAMDPPLHERVYEGLKEDYLQGHFVPGKKIDIQVLASRHRSSKTPVREAAFILVGEGLFKHHADGGFVVPDHNPQEIIDLLNLHMKLIAAALSILRETSIRKVLTQSVNFGHDRSPVEVAIAATGIFVSLADATGNSQTASTIRHLNEKIHYSRIAEISDPAIAQRELQTIVDLNVVNLPKATRRRIEAYHLRKIAHQERIIQNASTS